VMWIARDVTEQKNVEASLRKAEATYRSIFENALEGIFQSSPDGCFININPAMARIYGYDSPEEMIASVTDIQTQIYVNPRDRTQFRYLMEQYGQVQGLEYQAYRKDGSTLWVEIDARAVQDRSGKVLYYEGMIQDISDRKHREEELRRQLAELKIEIDHKKREQEVALITQSGYFQELQDEVSTLSLDEFWS
ncbi:MAG TPA: histidine kinase, partial [Cyanobacteria bacterium UBA11148]|nr:histidine kinase [Cyanobacteria bacterium UBA11148]